MHIECFAYFYKVAMAKSISKVAGSSHISQSALSQQIQKLEESLGHQLLIRSNKGVELTQIGDIVFKYSDNIIRTYNKMVEEISNYENNTQKLHIEACWPIATYALPCTLYDMKKKYMAHNYILKSNSSRMIEQNILNNISDLGFIYGEPQDKNLTSFEIGFDDIVLVAPFDMDIPDRVSVKELFSYQLVMLEDNLRVKRFIRSHLMSIGFKFEELNILFDMDTAEAVKSSLSQGVGLSFLPYISVKKELYRKQLKTIKITDMDIRYPIYLVYKKETNQSEVLMEFVKSFMETGKKSFC
ncbi:MAG: LysR family transcriptional regulator [delta proteobacterium ML8_F1]|nr:MAG: LysR family transcriptional regulator [delta proteobacterium ML8_F1]